MNQADKYFLCEQIFIAGALASSSLPASLVCLGFAFVYLLLVWRELEGKDVQDLLPIIRANAMDSADKLQELKIAVLIYVDNRPDDEQATPEEIRGFKPTARRLENLLGVEEGRCFRL